MIVKILGLDFKYKNKNTLEYINLEFQSSGLHFVLGENGSGKSTLLKCLCGLLSPQIGTITLDGVDLSQISIKERAKKIAYTPQHINFESNIYVFDFILQGRKPWFTWKETSIDEKEVFNVIEKFGIADLAFRSLGELSGGERQKVVLARTFVQDTPILILDEPTNNLDLSFQLELFKILLEESLSSNRLVIMAIHDINMALRYSHTVTMLRNGRVLSTGMSEKFLTEETIFKMMGIKNKIVNVDNLRVMVPLI